MTEGGHKDKYNYPNPNDDDLEWWAEHRMNIRDVRGLWSTIDYYQSIWPGPPERPEMEKEFLNGFKNRLFAMITDYNYNHHIVSSEDATIDDA